MKHIDRISSHLIEAGRSVDEPVAIVTDATLSNQRVLETTLGRASEDAANEGFGAPAIICVGRAVLMRQALDWAAMASGEAPRNVDPLERDADWEVS